MLDNDFGWINDPKHKIKPRPNKNAVVDFIIGLIPMVIGAGYIAVTSFINGAHAYETSQFEVFEELGLLDNPEVDDTNNSESE